MVEKVIVKGGGTIDGAQFDNAATEATLLRLLDAMKGKKDGSSGEEAKLRELASRALQNNTSSTNSSTSARYEETKSVSEVSKTSKIASASLSALGNGLSFLTSGVLSLAVTAGTKFISFFTEGMTAFRETSSVGASFNNDLVMLRRTAADAAMPLDEFSSMISKNSSLMASLGGSVTQGAMQFAQMSKEMRVGDVGTKLMGMGMTMGDINDYLGSYLEIQQRTGRVQGKSQTELVAGAQAYALEMDKLTKLTGMSRKEAEAVAKKASLDPIISALRKGLNSEELAKSSANLALANKIGGQEMEDAMKSLAAGRPDELGKMMMQAGFSMEDAEKAIKGGIDPNELRKRLGQMSESAKRMGLVGNATLNSFKPVFASMQRLADNTDMYSEMDQKAAEDQQAKRNKITEALGSFQQMWEKFTGDLMVSIIDSGVFKNLTDGLSALATKFLKYGPQISTAFTSLVGDLDKAFQTDDLMTGISNAFGVLFAKITPMVKDLFKSLISGMFGKSGEKKTAGDGASRTAVSVDANVDVDPGPFDELMKNMKESFPIIGKIESAINAVSWAFENWGIVLLAGGGALFAMTKFVNVGKMLGGLAEGVLSGIANGIKAFASPQIAIGALILAGAIVVIGGAVAAATWMMGKALPTFAEGMKSFETLNGTALIEAGKGIGAVGAGLAVFGAGSFVGGLGGMIGSWAESLTSGKSLVEKLQDFQKMDLDAPRIENNANAVVAYGKAMAALGAGGAIGSLGGLVSAAADGLTKFFGGNPIPWAKIQEFQTITLDGDKIEKNSNAVVAYMKAMASLGAGNAVGSLAGLVSAVADGLTKFFGGTIRLPWDRMIEFQNVGLDVDKIRKNADAVIAFSSAMANLPDIKTETSGGAFSYIGSFFSGSQVMPWDKLKEFGDVKLDGDKIRQNAEILKVFGDSVKTFSSAGSSSITKVGSDFASQAAGVNTFTESIKNLNKAITDLNASLATIAKSSIPGGGKSNLEVVSTALGGANTGGGASSEKLNTLVTELVSLTKDIKESSKDQADALKGRRDAL